MHSSVSFFCVYCYLQCSYLHDNVHHLHVLQSLPPPLTYTSSELRGGGGGGVANGGVCYRT